MFSSTLTALAAAAAIHSPSVTVNTIAANAPAVSPATVTAVATVAAPKKPAIRIPGTFEVASGDDALNGVSALYVVRSGDGA
jgi:hypothetical protein